MLRTRLIGFLVAALAAVSLAAPSAQATTILVTPDQDLMTLGVGDTFTVVVGLDDRTELSAYTLDVQWQLTPLTFVSSKQLTCKELAGFCIQAAFNSDPGAGLAVGNTGRASVLTAQEILYADGRTDLPEVDTRAGLFALTFMANAAGAGTLTAGILDSQADYLSRVIIRDPITQEIIREDPPIVLGSPTTTVDFLVVPEPTSAVLLWGAALFALVLRGRR